MKVKIIRRTLGKPFSKLISEDLIVTPKMLNTMGKIILEEVISEAKKEYARQKGLRTPRGEPEGLPGPPPFKANQPQGRHKRDIFPEFLKSFDYKIVGNSTVAITSSWPWIEQLTEGRPPYPMPWLTRSQGIDRVPIVKADGTVIVRTTPMTTSKAWIHPGFKKHNFIRRGVEKGRKKAAAMIHMEIKKRLNQVDFLK